MTRMIATTQALNLLTHTLLPPPRPPFVWCDAGIPRNNGFRQVEAPPNLVMTTLKGQDQVPFYCIFQQAFNFYYVI